MVIAFGLIVNAGHLRFSSPSVVGVGFVRMIEAVWIKYDFAITIRRIVFMTKPTPTKVCGEGFRECNFGWVNFN